MELLIESIGACFINFRLIVSIEEGFFYFLEEFGGLDVRKQVISQAEIGDVVLIKHMELVAEERVRLLELDIVTKKYFCP